MRRTLLCVIRLLLGATAVGGLPWLAAIAAVPVGAQESSAAIQAACTPDIKRLCPNEYAHRHADGGAAIGGCMKAHALAISGRCIKAWLFEHPEKRK